MSKTAIIIKGNPELIERNEEADIFYKDLENFIKSLGFEVEFDPGEPYTQPKAADLWIGHSRGSDRLRFAPPETIVIGIGVPENPTNNFPVINHPEDLLSKEKENPNHYILTEEMKKEIIKIIEIKEKVQ